MRQTHEERAHAQVAVLASQIPNRVTQPQQLGTQVTQEIVTVLAASAGVARRSFVTLVTALNEDLVAEADVDAFRTCLGSLIVSAISRAHSEVLVTASCRSGYVEIVVVDDGSDPSGGHGEPRQTVAKETVPIPAGGTLNTSFDVECGTTVLLRLPEPSCRKISSIGKGARLE
jgi:hypothetical protein